MSLNIPCDTHGCCDSDTTDVTVTPTGEEPVIVTIEDGCGSPGSTGNPVTISADNQSQNTTPIGAGELWVVYDASIGVTLTNVITTARTVGWTVGWDLDTSSDPPTHTAHILLYNMSGWTIASGTGPILELLFDVDASASAGDSSPLSFDNVLLADQLVNPIPVDFTDTGQFTIMGECEKDGDINDDGDVNIFDLSILINMILHSPRSDYGLYPQDWWCRGDLAPPPDGNET